MPFAKLADTVRRSASVPVAPTAYLASAGHDLSQLIHAARPIFDSAERLKKETRELVTIRTTNLSDRRALSYLIMGLLGETGELIHAMLIARNAEPTDRPACVAAVRSELGDVLWSVVAIGEHFGVPFEEVAAALTDKMNSRHPERMGGD